MNRISFVLLVCALSPPALATQDAGQARPELDTRAVIDWVTENAIPLETPEAGNGFEDMQALARVVGDARIVSLGEATHGTREFFQLKHRMLEFLVERMGFTVFGIEASYPECEAINDYIERGVGDPEAALHGQGFWTWDTEEVLALIEWMRAYNLDQEHERKLRFYGIDMQLPKLAVERALEYVKAHDSELWEFLAADLEPLTRTRIIVEYGGLDDDERQGLDLGLNALLEFFDFERAKLVAASSESEWAVARQHAVVASQAKNQIAGEVGAYGLAYRDKCMADNATWILGQHPEGTRMVLWAHNGHVKRDGPPRGMAMMGHFLEQEYGDDHTVFGFGFHHGGFQAIVSPREPGDRGPGLRSFEVGTPTEGTIDAVLGEAGYPIYALDLRLAPAEGPVAEWLDSSLPMRWIGSIYSNQTAERWYRPTILGEQFDVLIFLQETTAARPNPLTRRAHGIEERK